MREKKDDDECVEEGSTKTASDDDDDDDDDHDDDHDDDRDDGGAADETLPELLDSDDPRDDGTRAQFARCLAHLDARIGVYALRDALEADDWAARARDEVAFAASAPELWGKRDVGDAPAAADGGLGRGWRGQGGYVRAAPSPRGVLRTRRGFVEGTCGSLQFGFWVFADRLPSPIGHGPIELDSNICLRLQRTLVTVAVVSLAVMCSYGPDRLLGAFE